MVVKVSVSPELTRDSIAAHLERSVEGSLVPFSDQVLSDISDISKIKKTYKLGALPSPESKVVSNQVDGAQSVDDAKRRLELTMFGAIALRGS